MEEPTNTCIRVESVLCIKARENEVFVSFDSPEDAKAFEVWVRSGLCWNAFEFWRSKAPRIFT